MGVDAGGKSESEWLRDPSATGSKMSIAAVGRAERLIGLQLLPAQIVMGASVKQIFGTGAEAAAALQTLAAMYADEMYLVCPRNGRVFVMLHGNASGAEVLRAFFHASLLVNLDEDGSMDSPAVRLAYESVKKLGGHFVALAGGHGWVVDRGVLGVGPYRYQQALGVRQEGTDGFAFKGRAKLE